jgi:phosphatidate cytidylyltransferase
VSSAESASAESTPSDFPAVTTSTASATAASSAASEAASENAVSASSDTSATSASTASAASSTGGAGNEPPKKPRAGRNLPIAIGVGLVLGAMVLASLYYVKQLFLGVLIVFLVQGLRELAGGFGAKGIRVPLAPLVAGMVATPVAAYAWGPEALVAALSLTVLVTLVWRMAVGPAEGYVRDVTAAAFASGYLILMGGVVALLMAPGDGDHRIVIFIAVTVASDIGGYFAGTFFGRHRLAPAISPKKTWEGAAGSALACMLVGAWLVGWLLDDGALWHGLVIGAAAAVVAITGDLIESMLKRDLGIKDMGALLPEHGGVLDRIDSLVATAPVVWLLLEVLVPSVP